MKKQEKALQEEVKRLTEELADALKLIKELQGESERTVFVCVSPTLLHILCVCLPLLARL